jgi:hypothetical protein
MFITNCGITLEKINLLKQTDEQINEIFILHKMIKTNYFKTINKSIISYEFKENKLNNIVIYLNVKIKHLIKQKKLIFLKKKKIN